MRLILASNNEKKLRELRRLLDGSGYEVVSQKEAGLFFEAEETGTTFAENAYCKAKAALDASHEPCVADDSGLCVDALNGEPGVYSARYGGGGLSDSEKYTLLLHNMEGKENRKAHFASAVVCLFPNGDRLDAYGECAGEIAYEPSGEGGFGYDPVFLVGETGKTMAQLSPEEKDAVSHRGKALREFQEKLTQYGRKNSIC